MILNCLNTWSCYNSCLWGIHVRFSFNSIRFIGFKRIIFYTLFRAKHLAALLAHRTIRNCCVTATDKTWFHDIAGKRKLLIFINLLQIMYFCFKIHFALLKHERRLLEVLFSVCSLVLKKTGWRCARSNASSPLLSVEQFKSISAVFNRFKF